MTKTVKHEIEDGDWSHYYREYQVRLANEYLLPILGTWGFDPSGKRVLDVGGGDGGCAAAFHRAGSEVVMMDIEERLVDGARRANEREGIEAKVFAGDIYDEDAAFYSEGPFDLIMFRDVMEHLEDPVRAMRIVSRRLSVDGRVLVVFPPYYSPFGAHQQILPRKSIGPVPYNKLPFIQWLPDRAFGAITRGDDSQSREVARLRGIRLTISKFNRAIAEAGFGVLAYRPYLSRPTFALRYGLPVVRAHVVGRVPLLREACVTAAYYLIAPENRH